MPYDKRLPYEDFIIEKLSDKSIYEDVDTRMVCGKAVRDKVMDTPFQPELEEELESQWECVSGSSDTCAFVVRSPVTAEDLLDASFEGQLENGLDVMGYDGLKSGSTWSSPRSSRTARTPTATTAASSTPRCS